MTTCSVMDFGAVGNGVADDTTAFLSALSNADKVIMPRPAVRYRLTAGLALNGEKSLIGEAEFTKVHKDFAGAMFTLRNNENVLHNIGLEGNPGQVGAAIYVDSAAGAVQYNDVSKIRMINCYNGIEDGGASIGIKNRFKDITMLLHKNRGIILTRQFAYTDLENITVDYTQNAAVVNIPAVVIVNAEGVRLNKVDVTGSNAIGPCGTQYGFWFQNSSAIWLNECMADTVGGVGFYFSNVNHAYLASNVASLCGSHGFHSSSSDHVIGIGNYATSNAGRGLVHDGAGSLSFTGGKLASNAGGHFSLGSAKAFIAATGNSGGASINFTGPGAA